MQRMKNVVLRAIVFAVASCACQQVAAQCTTISALPYTISASGQYCLGADLATSASTGISIGTSNVEVDCGGHSVTKNAGNAAGSQGITTNYVNNLSGITVKNCKVQGFDTAIRAKGINIEIANNRLNQPKNHGIYASGNNVRINGNKILDAFSDAGNNFQQNITVDGLSWSSMAQVVKILDNTIVGSHGNPDIIAIAVDGDDIEVSGNRILDLRPSAGGEALTILGGVTQAKMSRNAIMARVPNVVAPLMRPDLCEDNVHVGLVTNLGQDGVAGIARCATAIENYEKP